MNAHKQMIQIDTIWYNGGEMEVIRDLDSVKRLVTENARLREALRVIAESKPHIAEPLDWRTEYEMLQAHARSALTPQPANT